MNNSCILTSICPSSLSNIANVNGSPRNKCVPVLCKRVELAVKSTRRPWTHKIPCNLGIRAKIPSSRNFQQSFFHWQQHVTYHFIKNVSCPPESVAPIIFSGLRPLAKPRGRCSSDIFAFFVVSGLSFNFRFLSSAQQRYWEWAEQDTLTLWHAQLI